jgi:hypothetical protein
MTRAGDEVGGGTDSEEGAKKAAELAIYKQKNAKRWRAELQAKFSANALATKNMFLSEYGMLPPLDAASQQVMLSSKILDEYEAVKSAKKPGVIGDGWTQEEEAEDSCPTRSRAPRRRRGCCFCRRR